MCGIGAFIELMKNKPNYEELFADFMNMKPRGPDITNFQIIKNLTIVFHRLAIMEPNFHANQPYIIEDGERTIVFLCNGEIYDFKQLIKEHNLPIENNSDCMTIPQLYLKYVKYNNSNNINQFYQLFKNNIKGEFAFLLFEFDKFQNMKEIIAGRDTFGVKPLYFGKNTESIMFASEIKGMLHYKGDVSEFEPGTLMHYHLDNFGEIRVGMKYDFKNLLKIVPEDNKLFLNIENKKKKIFKSVREAVINSVKRRLVSDKPIAFLLSGGVDSSLVAGISAKLLGTKINTYCCGMVGGTDLKYARIAAEHINSNHHEVIFTVEDALSRIENVIYTTETYDVTSIRASIGQSIVCEYIAKNSDAKVILVGEGADECCSSYITNWYAPTGKDIHDTALEYLSEIHLYDGRRVDRNVSNFGLEARVALLDPEFVNAYLKIPMDWRHPKTFGIEKYFLREAFAGTDVLCDTIRLRKKEAFSDGVSSTEKSWFQILQEHIDTLVSDEEFNNNRWECSTKEQYYYMKVFVGYFSESRLSIIPHMWQPKFLSDGTIVNFNDKKFYINPSARILGNAYS
jgi:asparagine synthase (glutamine-hydrolysing)